MCCRVVQFYFWLKLCFPLFWGMVIYGNSNRLLMIMSFKQRTEPRIKHADKIEPQNMGLDLLIGYYVCPCWNCVVFLLWSLDWVPKSPIANRPSCRSKWSEGEEACQCFLLYILTCITLINPQGWYLHQMELESGYDFPEVVMTTEGVWDDVTFRHQIFHWLSWVFTMQFSWLNLT